MTLIGQFQNVVGTPGNDSIKGDSSANVLSGGGGSDTLIGGTGPATLVAGSGSDLLVAGSGGTTFQFLNQPTFGTDTIDPPSTSGTNKLDFSQFGGPVSLNLASTATQTMSGTTGLALILQTPSEINALVDSVYGDNITGNNAGDQFFVGSGNDTFTGGGGADSFFFGGSPFGGSALGSDVITETSSANTLNFYGFDGPVNLNLKQTGTQTVSQGTASSLKLNLSNPAAFSTVIGTPFGGTIVGNDNAHETIVGGAGLDSLVAGAGIDSLQANAQQVVYLDFPLAGSSNGQAGGGGPADTSTSLNSSTAGGNTTYTATVAASATLAPNPDGHHRFLRHHRERQPRHRAARQRRSHPVRAVAAGGPQRHRHLPRREPGWRPRLH